MKKILMILLVLLGLNAYAEDRRVVIVNHTSFIMESFYASNIARPNWEEDIFGDGVLYPGESVVINIDDGTYHCLYDLKAVFRGGYQVTKKRADVCTVVYWEIKD